MGAVGIVLAGGNGERVKELARNRAISAMPVGGNYRAIDFTLSNMSNSGIKKIAVLSQYNSRSLRDHLSSSKWWDLGRKNGGLFVFTPYLTQDSPNWWYKGTADAIYQNIEFLKKSTEEHVVIASGEQVYNIDFDEVIRYHDEKQADITMIYKPMPQEENLSRFGVLLLNEQGRMIDYEEKPIEPFSRNVSIGSYVIKRVLLMKILREVVQEGKYDFVNDVIMRFRRKLNIYGYEYNGYWKVIDSTKSYYNLNMDLLEKEVQRELFKREKGIYTKVKDEPPAKYNDQALVKNSIVPCGCIIDSSVENSVLFRGVQIGQNSVIRNSIIMEGCYIGNNCVIENAILDKYVVISDGNKIIGYSDDLRILPKEMVV